MNSVAYDKAFSFALDIIELYKNLTLKKKGVCTFKTNS